ncbi:unnamed protein product [Orchesella dallaii]|uniref:Uncharacterized protein n=1 Tax=Orchesella dallaii TaxID=48710 RepID=A0ABP1QZ72_9HEXA
MNPEREVIELDPDPGHRVETEDFDSVAELSVWSRSQREHSKFVNTFVIFAMNTTLFVFESASLIYIVLHGLSMYEKGYDPETVLSVGLWMLCAILSTYVKFVDDTLTKMPRTCCKAIGEWFLNLLLPIKIVRYLVSFHYRIKKQRLLGRRFINMEPLGRVQVASQIAVINKKELIDARYDLYETYVQAIPMALLQNYFLFAENKTFQLCDFRDAARLLVVILHLISAAKCSAIHDWKKKQYETTLHVYGHLKHRGRYPMPKTIQDHSSRGLNTMCHFLSLFSRFYLISFFLDIHWSFGILCMTLLFGTNLSLYHLLASVRSPVENLPVGFPLSLSYMMDRWINIFTAKETRFNEISRRINRLCFRGRYPGILTQVVTFLISFLSTYFTISVLDFETTTKRMHQSMLEGRTSRVVNSSLCYVSEHDPSGAMKYINDFFSSAQSMINGRFGTFNDFYNIFHLHWLLMYAHFLAAIVYNFYIYKFDLLSDDYPSLLSIKYLRAAAWKIFRGTSTQTALQLSVARRYLFLISCDLNIFYKTYNAYYCSDAAKGLANVTKWWDSRVRHELDKTESRGRDEPPNWTNSPLFTELDLCFGIIRMDPLGKRMFSYCVTNMDRVFCEEMTSDRLIKTFEMLGLDKFDMCHIISEEDRSTALS